MKNNKALMNNSELLMFYHTTFRNVAVTTAVSYATLGYSRYYRGKSKMYVSGLVFVSLLLVSCSIFLNYNLYNIVLEHYYIDKKINAANRFLILNKIFLLIHIILLGFVAYTLFRIITNNTF